MKMQAGLKIMMLLVVAVAVSGCYTTGLSSQEAGLYNYSNIVYGLYSDKEQTSKPAARVFDPQGPIKLGVAQVGEHVPHSALLKQIEEQKQMFGQVSALPLGGRLGSGTGGYYAQNEKEEDVSNRIVQLCRMAEDLGLDYVFLFGGKAEMSNEPTAWSLLDLTIVGAYLIPSQKVQLDISAIGVLIDVQDSRPIFFVNADHQARKRSAAVYLPDYYGSRQDVFLAEQKEAVVSQLADQFVEKMKMYF